MSRRCRKDAMRLRRVPWAAGFVRRTVVVRERWVSSLAELGCADQGGPMGRWFRGAVQRVHALGSVAHAKRLDSEPELRRRVDAAVVEVGNRRFTLDLATP